MHGQTADKTVLHIRVGWLPAIVAGAGLALTVLGLTPAQATPVGGTATHQAYVCRYVGHSLRLASGVNPALVDVASVPVRGFVDDPHNGHIYVLIPNSSRLPSPPSIADCPGYTPPTTTTTSTTTGPTVTPSASSTTSSITSTTTQPTVTASGSSTTSSTTSTTTQPTVTASGSSTTTTTTQPTVTASGSSTTTTTTQPTVTASGSSTTPSTTTKPPVSTTSSPVTSPTVTGTPVVHTPADPKPPAATSHHPSASHAAANVVPLAATDGADLAGQPVQSPRDGLLASGFLLMVAAGVLSTRRTDAE